MKIFVNPASGNEPFILGALIAQAYGNLVCESIQIVMPLLYDRQALILQEHGIEAILDHELGNLIRPVLFKNGDFNQHVADVVAQRERVESAIRTYVKERYGRFDFELNTGSKIRVADEIYYAFPVATSQLFFYVIQEGGIGFNQENLEHCLRMMETVEQDFTNFFIPAIHTFSYDSNRSPVAKEISTPPLKPTPRQCTIEIPPQSVYCMPSGTGSEVQTVLQRAAELMQQGHEIIIPPWIRGTTYRQEKPFVIVHENIVRVVGRAGWGTLWTCQQSNTAFEHVPYTRGDDPEIYFNIRTLEAIPLLQATSLQKRRFSTQNGIAYVANYIVSQRR